MLENRKNRILVVDDEPSIRKAIQMSLQAKNYIVEVAVDGSEAILKNGQHPFDLAILDLVLPNANGLEILRALRKDAPDLLAVIITGSGSLQSSIEAIELEVSAYIEKPLRMDSILKAVFKGLHDKAKKEDMVREQVEALSKELCGDISIDKTASYYIHQVNNPLTSILGYAELAMMSTDSPDSLHECLTQIIESSEKIKSINRAFLKTGSNLHGLIEHIDPVSILDQCLKEFEATFRLKRIAVSASTTHSKAGISGNRFELEQVFKNLMANAIDALEGYAEKTLHIETEIPASYHHMLIHIQDNGCGIPEETLKDIFQLKFTTKPKGNGIGLYIVRELIRRMNGDILVESVVGKGTKFTLKLPVSDSFGVQNFIRY